jgi:hypothetical protein
MSEEKRKTVLKKKICKQGCACVATIGGKGIPPYFCVSLTLWLCALSLTTRGGTVLGSYKYILLLYLVSGFSIFMAVVCGLSPIVTTCA